MAGPCPGLPGAREAVWGEDSTPPSYQSEKHDSGRVSVSPELYGAVWASQCGVVVSDVTPAYPSLRLHREETTRTAPNLADYSFVSGKNTGEGMRRTAGEFASYLRPGPGVRVALAQCVGHAPV